MSSVASPRRRSTNSRRPARRRFAAAWACLAASRSILTIRPPVARIARAPTLSLSHPPTLSLLPAIQEAQRHRGDGRDADRQRLLVDVEARVVVAVDEPTVGVVRADVEEAAGGLLEEVGHVLRAHRRL